MSALQSLREYEQFIYSLAERHPEILQSTLTIQRRGRRLAELRGEVVLRNGVRLRVYERLAWETGTVTLIGYSYEAWRDTTQLYWYDSQPHPGDPLLASTHPHHKHLPPDLKHHRVPAPDLSFTAPNLPFVIREADAA
jgi:hypothetical protein